MLPLLCLSFHAHAMSAREAVDAALARSPTVALSEARIQEAEGRIEETKGRLMPSASVTAGASAQTKIEANIADNLPREIVNLIPEDAEITPLVIMPGFQVQAGGQVVVPLIAPQGWSAVTLTREAAGLARTEAEMDRTRITAATLEAWHSAWEAQALLAQARRGEELARGLLAKGDSLVSLGAIASGDLIPFRRALATAEAEVANATAAVEATQGVLGMLTGLTGAPDEPALPEAPPNLATILDRLDRPDLRAASERVAVADRKVSVERNARLPTVGLGAGLLWVDPPPDIGEDLTWRVGVQATIPVFQGGVVSGKVSQADAQAAQAAAGANALRELAELEIRIAYGTLSRSLGAVRKEEAVVSLAQDAVRNADTKMNEGGGTLLQLQQAQLELIAAEARLTQAKAQAARAADLLTVASKGTW